jgi:hypothetical protein
MRNFQRRAVPPQDYLFPMARNAGETGVVFPCQVIQIFVSFSYELRQTYH